MQNNCSKNVISFGNSWVVCKSKSYNGRVYYFNTLTGVAAWNLSDVEKEKCNNATNLISCSDIQTGKYPEPKNSPFDHSNIGSSNHNCDQTETASLKYNVSSINNSSITHIQMPLLTEGHCSNCKTLLTRSDTLKSPELNQNVCNTSLNPSQSSNILFHNKTEDNRFVQSTSLTLNRRFENLNITVNNYDENIINEENYKKVLCNEIQTKVDYPNRFNSKNDLRQLLSSKRNNNLIVANDDSTVASNLSRENKRIHERSENTSNNKLHQEDSNKSFFTQVNNYLKTKTHKIDLTRLKNIAKQSAEENNWYIVADVNVLIKHYKFLRILVDSDKDCRLIVLKDVLVTLQKLSRSMNITTRKRARLSMNFISNIITTGSLILTKGPKLADNTGKSVLDGCMKLLEDNYRNIILLCNDINLREHKDAASIPIFTVNELKLYLNSNSIAETEIIKNWKEEAGNKKNDESSNKAMVSMLNDNNNKNDNVPAFISVGVQGNNLPSQKKTVDAEVQTDLTFEILTRIFSSECIQGILTNNFEKCSQHEVNRETCFIGDTAGKQFKLKLNRAISDQSSNTSNDKDNPEKRNFKWRRKRPRPSIAQNNDTCLHEEKKIQPPVKVLKHTINLLENQSNDVTNNYSNKQIMKEASTSEVAFDALRSIDSESISRQNVNKILSTKSIYLCNKDINESKNVMFEVTSKDMEDNLKTCCDKWVTRFIQIMEEVLNLVLQNDPLESNDSSTPPRYLFEAIQFIKMRFSSDKDTIDAAYKLAETLLKMNAGKGEININISPKQYMEMYSYGVYLVDALQAANSNSEIIQTAAEALAKLLNDIQNPVQHTIHNELLIDKANETLVSVGNIMDREPEKKPSRSIQKQAGSSTSYNTQSEPNFMSQSNTEKESGCQMFRNSGDEISLPILNLDRTKGCEDDNAVNIQTIRAQTPTLEPMLPEAERKDISEPVDKNKKLSVSIKLNETKFIRNFTTCADFENRIKCNEMLGSNEEMDDKYSDHDFSGTDGSSEFLCEDYVDNEENDTNNYNKNSNKTNDENNSFKNVTRNFLQKIRGTFFLVYCFCLKYQNSCNTNDLEENNDTILRAREIQTDLSNICNDLISICKRDEDTSAKNIVENMKCDNDFEGLTFTEIDLKKYRLIIAKCLEQAILLRKSIEAILCACTSVDIHT